MDLIICMGLPGSGKTTFAKNQNYNAVDFDCKYTRDDFPRNVDLYLKNNKVLVLDGLFLSYNDIYKLLSMFHNFYGKIDVVSIEYFIPNIKNCLHNDRYRRDISSNITIKNAKMDEINNEFISNLETDFPLLKNKIIYNLHEVGRKSMYQLFIDKYKLHLDKEEYVFGESWSLGGTWRNCWDRGGDIEEEDKPSFSIFWDLLNDCLPDDSVLKEEVYNKFVQDDTFFEHDYYGGCETRGVEYFNAKYLFDYLMNNTYFRRNELLEELLND